MTIHQRSVWRFFLIFVGLGAAVCFGQDITGSIRGSVLDPSGAGIGGAKVTVTNTDRNVVLRTSADVLENAAAQVEVLAEEWPEYGEEARRFARFSQRVSAAASQVGHKSKVRRRR